MAKDAHGFKGGFLRPYGLWFKSIGLYGQKWTWHLKVGKFDFLSVVLNDPINCFLVQRWFSGIFGVGTIDWFKDRNSMHEIWELNENLMKQKYRMHNIYVQVGRF